MSEKQGKVAKPEKTKPNPVKPEPIKTNPIKPLKAHGRRSKHCIRCATEITETTGVVRRLCSPCDLQLQEMHYAVEHTLYNNVVYMPDPKEVEWFADPVNYGKWMSKPFPPPKRRNYFRYPPREALPAPNPIAAVAEVASAMA